MKAPAIILVSEVRVNDSVIISASFTLRLSNLYTFSSNIPSRILCRHAMKLNLYLHYISENKSKDKLFLMEVLIA